MNPNDKREELEKLFDDIEHYVSYTFSCIHPSEDVALADYNLKEAKRYLMLAARSLRYNKILETKNK